MERPYGKYVIDLYNVVGSDKPVFALFMLDPEMDDYVEVLQSDPGEQVRMFSKKCWLWIWEVANDEMAEIFITDAVALIHGLEHKPGEKCPATMIFSDWAKETGVS